jgi:hypothetical protein
MSSCLQSKLTLENEQPQFYLSRATYPSNISATGSSSKENSGESHTTAYRTGVFDAMRHNDIVYFLKQHDV